MEDIHAGFLDFVNELKHHIVFNRKPSSCARECGIVIEKIKDVQQSVSEEMDDICLTRDLTTDEADAVIALTKELKKLYVTEMIFRAGLEQFERMASSAVTQ